MAFKRHNNPYQKPVFNAGDGLDTDWWRGDHSKERQKAYLAARSKKKKKKK